LKELGLWRDTKRKVKEVQDAAPLEYLQVLDIGETLFKDWFE